MDWKIEINTLDNKKWKLRLDRNLIVAPSQHGQLCHHAYMAKRASPIVHMWW